MSDSLSINDKRIAFALKMDETNQLRKLEISKRKELKSENDVTREEIDTFISEFTIQISTINKLMDTYVSSTEQYELIISSVDELQKKLAEASLYLPNYDIRVSQAV